MISDIAPAPTG